MKSSANNWKIASLLLLIVTVPTFLSVVVFQTFPSYWNLGLLFAVGVAMVHPYLGLPSAGKLINLEEPVVETKPTTPSEPTAPTTQVFSKEDTYIHHLKELKQKFLEYSDLEKEPTGSEPNCPWDQVLSQERNGFKIEVHKRKHADFVFRVVVEFEATMAETFDLMGNISKRAIWDEVAESSGVVELISPKTSINVVLFK